MVIKSVSCPLFFVNLFADFILNTIPVKEKTIIKVIDCENFWVIKGKTSHEIPLDITSLKNDFITRFSNLLGEKLNFKTIDLIEYGVDLSSDDAYEFKLFNTGVNHFNYIQLDSYSENNSFSYDENGNKINNNSLVYISTFPFGYSFDMGRSLYYYAKYIGYNIPTNLPYVDLKIVIPSKKEKLEDSFKIITNYSIENDDTLKSAILDCFDFNTDWVISEKQKVDQYLELIDPLSEFDFLKEKKVDFIIP